MVRKRSWPAVSHCDTVSELAWAVVGFHMTYDLELHGLAIEFDSSDFLQIVQHSFSSVRTVISTYEIDTDGRNVGFCVGIVGETQQQARLSNTGVTDKEELEEVVVSMIFRSIWMSSRTGPWVQGPQRAKVLGATLLNHGQP